MGWGTPLLPARSAAATTALDCFLSWLASFQRRLSPDLALVTRYLRTGPAQSDRLNTAADSLRLRSGNCVFHIAVSLRTSWTQLNLIRQKVKFPTSLPLRLSAHAAP